MELGVSQGWSGRVQNISLSQALESSTVQTVPNRYTDYDLPAHWDESVFINPYPTNVENRVSS